MGFLFSNQLIVLFLGFLAGIFSPFLTFASDYGTSELASQLGYKTYAVDRDLMLAIVGKVIAGVLGFLGVVFLVGIVYYGFRWMTAGGKSDVVKVAKDGITNLVIGLILVLSAYAITSFILSILTNVNK
ncbi:MAG TPA: hypothetical protein PL066_03505 [bacterium]|nr:hypothetical protein [bacterium]